MNRKRILRSWWLWLIVILFAFFVLPNLLSGGSDYKSVDTSVAMAQLKSGHVTQAVLEDKEQVLQLTLDREVQGATKIQSSFPANSSNQVFNDLQKNGVSNYTVKVTKENTWLSLLFSLLPILLIVGVLFFVMSQVQGGGNRVMSFGRSKAKMVNKDTPKTTFNDVAGADEAIEELLEIKEFLANPAKFPAIGAKIPKGVLLSGPAR